MKEETHRQEIHVIEVGHAIVWSEKDKSVFLQDERGQMQRIWNRGKEIRKRDTKRCLSIVRSEAGLCELAILLADIFALSIEKIKLPNDSSWNAAFRFVPLKSID